MRNHGDMIENLVQKSRGIDYAARPLDYNST